MTLINENLLRCISKRTWMNYNKYKKIPWLSDHIANSATFFTKQVSFILYIVQYFRSVGTQESNLNV